VIRVRERHEVELPERLESWLASLAERPAVAAELRLVQALA